MRNLLIGNGLSISISDDFSYKSLREMVDNESSPAVDRLFKKLNTVDFEHLLTKVKDARDVIEALTDGQIVVSHAISDEIRSKLIEAIQSMNPRGPNDHGLDPQQLNKALKEYNNTFTTNYDIYLYWARMGDRGFNIIDFFFTNGFFDRTKTDKKGRDAIYFLHGALFIFETDNRVKKISKGTHPTLNESIQSRINEGKGYPLFISEGTPNEKLANIKSNEYLSFCYDELRSIEGDLDIYGHSLNPDVDGHIIDAIRESNVESISYYQYKFNQMTDAEKNHIKAILAARLGENIQVIDASEHALCKWSIFEGF